jgi:hypothetical protein
LTRATLYTAGFHQHAGTWRRKRHAEVEDHAAGPPASGAGTTHGSAEAG